MSNDQLEPIGSPEIKFPYEMSQRWMIAAGIFTASIITLMMGFAIGMHAEGSRHRLILEEQAYSYSMVGYSCAKNGNRWDQCAADLRKRFDKSRD